VLVLLASEFRDLAAAHGQGIAGDGQVVHT
jgi:hypothetical protein